MTHVLIADDEPNILLLTEMLFKDMGMNVSTAKDGKEALEKIESLRPDLVITDIIMPHKSGIEICKDVRSNPEIADIPIIILSALGDDYNKINGFEGGADDYMTKPFNVEELKARANALLLRYKGRKQGPVEPTEESPSEEASKTLEFPEDMTKIQTNIPGLDKALYGGIPAGSNILLLGPTGCSKSHFAREFLRYGVEKGERCLFVALDDNPQLVKREIDQRLNGATLEETIQSDLLRFVDAYSWTTLTPAEEKFAVTGMLDLNQLSGIISDAGYELGQTVQHKAGGRRVIDSISSLLIHFDLSSVQRFLSQIARTAVSFGDVTTLFIIEEGTVDDQVLNNIKYIMDGVFEFRRENNQREIKVGFMKWAQYNSEWAPF